jgi:hypothetical protein
MSTLIENIDISNLIGPRVWYPDRIGERYEFYENR